MKAITQNTTTKPPMLAKNWDNATRPEGWWMSEKLDGVRAIWDGENFRSRGGNIFHAPAWFKAGLPALPLDGELFVGRGKFNEAVSIVRATSKDWTPIKYLVFDIQADGPTEDRQRMLLGLQLPGHVLIVEQVLCQSRDALLEFERAILNAKGEGVTSIRTADSSGNLSATWQSIPPATVSVSRRNPPSRNGTGPPRITFRCGPPAVR